LEEAQARLPELIEQLPLGEEMWIVAGGNVIAMLTRPLTNVRTPRQPGSAIGKILFIAEDFDAPQEDFQEYQP
jgi:hypothetical protein